PVDGLGASGQGGEFTVVAGERRLVLEGAHELLLWLNEWSLQKSLAQKHIELENGTAAAVQIFGMDQGLCAPSPWWNLRLQDSSERFLSVVWDHSSSSLGVPQSEIGFLPFGGSKQVESIESQWSHNELFLDSKAGWRLGQCRIEKSWQGSFLTHRRWLGADAWQLNSRWELDLSPLQFLFDFTGPDESASLVFSCVAHFPGRWAGQAEHQASNLAQVIEPVCLGEVTGAITAELINVEDAAAGVLNLDQEKLGHWALKWMIQFDPNGKRIVHGLRLVISDLNLMLNRHDPWLGVVTQQLPVAQGFTAWEWSVP
ncbi:MAG: hypothetical protein R3194_11830, partial [Limnobacter sp.]|nr:hypothetical protein [Limnobacter sp.]